MPSGSIFKFIHHLAVAEYEVFHTNATDVLDPAAPGPEDVAGWPGGPNS